jgi:hypothetical protein
MMESRPVPHQNPSSMEGPCTGYLGYPFENKRGKSNVENLARSVDKEEKTEGASHKSIFISRTDIPSSQHRVTP